MNSFQYISSVLVLSNRTETLNPDQCILQRILYYFQCLSTCVWQKPLSLSLCIYHSILITPSVWSSFCDSRLRWSSMNQDHIYHATINYLLDSSFTQNPCWIMMIFAKGTFVDIKFICPSGMLKQKIMNLHLTQYRTSVLSLQCFSCQLLINTHYIQLLATSTWFNLYNEFCWF